MNNYPTHQRPELVSQAALDDLFDRRAKLARPDRRTHRPRPRTHDHRRSHRQRLPQLPRHGACASTRTTPTNKPRRRYKARQTRFLTPCR